MLDCIYILGLTDMHRICTVELYTYWCEAAHFFASVHSMTSCWQAEISQGLGIYTTGRSTLPTYTCSGTRSLPTPTEKSGVWYQHSPRDLVSQRNAHDSKLGKLLSAATWAPREPRSLINLCNNN